MENTFYWHDYETFGSNPRRDRAVQFAGIRTDLNLNVIGEPLDVFCKPADDCLPNPGACLVTGITPQQALENGVCEAEFTRQIEEQLGMPGTCGVGYNSIPFDDEVTRHLFYRNLTDPYSREWRNGNSRWDIINVARLCYALRPEGIKWPLKENGKPSFRLEELTQTNELNHENAHDALSDVHATIGLARLLKNAQPKLFEYCLKLRNKKFAASLLDLSKAQIVIHVSSKFPAENGCLSPIIPLAQDKSNPNSIICYDLRHNPLALLEDDIDSLKERMFTPKADLPEGLERVALKGIQINKSPIICPIGVLKDVDLDRINLDMETCRNHAQMLKNIPGLSDKITAIFERTFEDDPEQDVDLQLYSGAFLSSSDRRQLNSIIQMDEFTLSEQSFSFEDPRLDEMVFRYRARNYPQSLSSEEKHVWNETRYSLLNNPDLACTTSMLDYPELLQQYQSQYPQHSHLWQDLSAWYEKIQ